MKKRRKKAIKLVLNIYHSVLEEWRDLAHSHTSSSSSSNADCLDLFSPCSCMQTLLLTFL